MPVTVNSQATVGALTALTWKASSALGSGVKQAADLLSTDIVNLLGSKPYPPASTYETSPAIRTGNLQSSTGFDGVYSQGVGGYAAKVSTKAGYAAALEPPSKLNRPFFQVTLAADMNRIREAVVSALNGVL
jgi:hypothetical protein